MDYMTLKNKEWELFINVCLETITLLVDDGEDFNNDLVEMIVRDNAEEYGIFLDGENDIRKMISDVMKSFERRCNECR